MTQKFHRFSLERKWVLLATCPLVVVALMNFTGVGSGLARAGSALAMYEADHGHFPRHKSKYQSSAGIGFGSSSIPVELASLDLVGPVKAEQSVLLPALGSSAQVNSFFDVFTELSFGPGSEPFAIDSFFDITYRIIGADGGGGGGGGGSWPIEVVSMNLSGVHPTLGPIHLRESPTLGSAGQYMLTPLGGGAVGYQVDSFFDVFTELSIDGGPFVPADGAVRMNLTSLTPEPAAVTLAMMGAAGCGLAMRRRRR